MSKIIEAIKKIYPDIKGGFVYWETKDTGEQWKNKIDGLVWENKEYPKPTWDMIEEQLINVEIEELKNSLKSEIKQKRIKIAENSTVEYNGKNYANSQNGRIAINHYINKLTSTGTAEYFTYPEGELVNLKKTDFKEIADLIESNEIDARKREIILNQKIDSIEDIELLKNFDIEKEWEKL